MDSFTDVRLEHIQEFRREGGNGWPLVWDGVGRSLKPRQGDVQSDGSIAKMTINKLSFLYLLLQ